jgi:hypothetical protein
MARSKMAFARNAAGQVVAACDLPAIGPAIFHCAGCGDEVTLCRPPGSQAFFRHKRGAACELGALRALHAASLQLLVESRFVDAPAPTQNGHGQGKRRMIEEWGSEVSVLTKVDGVRVDLYAETLAGPLIIQIAIKSLYNATTRPSVKALGYAALEISIPKPYAIASVGELREVVLRGLTNKIWLWHPAISNRTPHVQPERRPVEMALFGEVEKAPTKLSVPVAAAPWVAAGWLAADAAYRQMSVTDKIRSLERQLGLPCARWPEAVDIEVVGKESFGRDLRIWQADVFGRFVHPGTQQGTRCRDFSMLTVLGWLYMRYTVAPTFEDAEKVAIRQYLRELTAQGYLMELPDQHFRVLPEPHPDRLSKLRWNPQGCLTVSALRVCSERVRLDIPVNQVQRLLEYFEDGHPALPVVAFVQDLMVRLHAPARTIVALLREAGLILG